MTDVFSVTTPDDLPNDPELLKARIHRLTILLGHQLIELDDLREDLRRVRQQNRLLWSLLTPAN